jgi:hypothetical protein
MFMLRRVSIVVLAAACSGGASKTDTSESDTSTSDTGSTTDTTTTVVETSDTATEPVCEVLARDGVEHDCMDLLVFCDVSPENGLVLEECQTCLGGFVDYYAAMQEAFGSDFYEVCRDVALPPRPETCSTYLAEAQGAATRLVEFNGFLPWLDDDVACNWAHEVNPYVGLPMPAVVETAETLAPYLLCLAHSDNREVPPPQAFFDSVQIGVNRVALYDERDWSWVGLYGDAMVFDTGCGGVSGFPPPVNIEAVWLDATLPALTDVACQLEECPADVRDAPLPP